MNTYEALNTKSSLWETLPDTAAEQVSGGFILQLAVGGLELDRLDDLTFAWDDTGGTLSIKGLKGKADTLQLSISF